MKTLKLLSEGFRSDKFRLTDHFTHFNQLTLISVCNLKEKKSAFTLIYFNQIGLKSAVFRLTSTASLEYDKSKYIFFSTGSSTNPPTRKVTEQC